MTKIASGLLWCDEPAPDPALGVFETMLVRSGRPIDVDEHLARLEASTVALYGRALPPSVRGEAAAAATGVAAARLRITAVPDRGRLAVDVDLARLDAAPRGVPLVAVAPVRAAHGLGSHKWLDRALVGIAEAAVAPAVPLFVDADGLVLESSRANVFARAGDTLITPPLDGRILPGITRAKVLRISASLGLAVEEAPLPVDELLRADEAFLTGSVRGIETVSRCGEAAMRASRSDAAARLERALRR